jgi:hypothetical protein
MNSGFHLLGLYVTYAVVALAALAGWVMNIITIAHSSFDVLTGMLVLRIVGIFVGPIGAILGWL